jgi:glycosyltransferase involved in cell wall biosynthesis
MLSVVIRNKNEEKDLAFLLKILTEKHARDIDEIIVLDNLSSDGSKEVAERYNAKFITIEKFSYGGSANIAAESASNDIVVLFSAHSFPISHDFFAVIRQKFAGRETELAGLRCLHNVHDYKAYMNGISSVTNVNKAGLNFAGSAFNKRMWREHPFKSDVRTFEDKEWSKRMVGLGYKIEFSPSVFCYNKQRTKAEVFFRFKNDVVGGYQLFHTQYTFLKACKNLVFAITKLIRNFFIDFFYLLKKFIFVLRFLANKPEQFK